MRVIEECVTCHLVLSERTDVEKYFLSVPYAPMVRGHLGHRIELRIEQDRIGQITPGEKHSIVEHFFAWLDSAHPMVGLCKKEKYQEDWLSIDDYEMMDEYKIYLEKRDNGHSKDSRANPGDDSTEGGGPT